MWQLAKFFSFVVYFNFIKLKKINIRPNNRLNKLFGVRKITIKKYY